MLLSHSLKTLEQNKCLPFVLVICPFDLTLGCLSFCSVTAGEWRSSASVDAHQTSPCPPGVWFGLPLCNVFPMKKSSPFPRTTHYSHDNMYVLFRSWRLCPPLLTLLCPEDVRNYIDSVSYSDRNCFPHITVPFSYDSVLIKATQAFWATEQGNRELCYQWRKQQASKQIFPSYTAVHNISFEPSRSRSSSGKSSDTFTIVIKENFRLSLQSCTDWTETTVTAENTAEQPASSANFLGFFFVPAHYFIIRKDDNMTEVCYDTV